MKITRAHVYVSRRAKPDMTPCEAEIREISYALKADNAEARATAAVAMAGRLRRHRACLLVPVPDSQGCTITSLRLCRAIQVLHPWASILDVLCGAPHESQCRLDHEGRHRLTADQIEVTARPADVPRGYENTVVYLVDNVCCTGAPLEACRRAVAAVLRNDIRGLVYARTKQKARN